MDKVKTDRRRGANLAGLALSAGLMLFTLPAMAHGQVDWSIGIGVGGPSVVYQQPPVVYTQPSVVYEQPAVVYERVYEQVPVVRYRESHDWRRERAWREHERREHEWREHHGQGGWGYRDGHDGWRR